jgi:hypothetical protein
MSLVYIFTHITKLQKIEAELRGIKPNEIKKQATLLKIDDFIRILIFSGQR